MKRFYVFKDGTQQGSTASKESAIDLIRIYQDEEAHPFVKSEFSIIEGEGKFVPYLLLLLLKENQHFVRRIP